MPYLKYFTFKTGTNPSVRSSFDLNCLTGSQKLQLASSRIFGNAIGGNMRSGNRALRAHLKGAKALSIFEIPIWDHQQWFPYLKDFENSEFKHEILEERKLRILMRGVKIGKKKGTGSFALMNIFEKKSDKPQQDKATKADPKKKEAEEPKKEE